MNCYSIVSILVLIALIYSPVITNSFNGDDFVHLQWLHQAVNQPELIWRNFHSSWLDITTAKFYRPLISIFMLIDYIIWHNNGIGFHLTNLLCHLANTLLVWLVLKNLLTRQSATKSMNHYIWCMSAAALFGLYPLHSEAVDWITARVDLFVTLFFLSSFLTYLYWRETKNRKWLCLSIAAFICSLLSKEMAIVLPAVIFMYELILGHKLVYVTNIGNVVVSAFKRSILFWLILIGYFFWRGYALGTLVGGYDSSFLPLGSWRLLIYLWKHSLYMLFIPFNQSLLTNGKYIIILWAALLLMSFALCVKLVLTDKENRAIFIFLCSWLVLSLVPVYKLFNIGTDLQGSRLAYLATVPLSILICFGLSYAVRNNKTAYWQIVILAITLSAAGAGLLVNNSAWIKAGATSKALVDQLNEISKTKVADTVIYIVGLPDEIDGAYVCRNALDGMTKYPQVAADIHNCFDLNGIDHIFPFGYALRSMRNITPRSSLPQFYAWHPAQQKLERFSLPATSSAPLEKNWSGENIKSGISLYVSGKPCIDMDFLVADSGLYESRPYADLAHPECGLNKSRPYASLAHPECGLNKSRPYASLAHPEYGFNKSRPYVNLTHPGSMNLAPTISLVQFCGYITYKNDLHPDGMGISALATSEKGKMIFPLHGQVDWALGGKCSEFKLESRPASCLDNCKINSAALVPAHKIMPILSFQGKANQNVIGYIELDKLHPSCQLNYDATKMDNVTNVLIELSHPNQIFAVPNDPSAQFSPPAGLLKKLSGLSGLATLTKVDFPEPGIYALRLRAVGEDNKYVGLAGDHIVITVR